MLRPWTAATLAIVALMLPLLAPAGAVPARSPDRAAIEEFALPQANSRPYSIVAGPDGALWFTESSRGVIGRITRSGHIREFPLSDPGAGPYGITAGADGKLWFTERFANMIGNITTAGVITEHFVPTPNAQPWDITALPNGTFWFTEENVDQVGKIDTSGNVSEYPTGEGQLPTSITTGPDGNVYFTEELGNNVVRLVPGDPPVLREFPLLTDGALPWDVNPGPDGSVWFTELAGRHIGKITSQGQVIEYPVPGEFGIAGIARGSDGLMWFTENDSGKVGSISVDGVVGMSFDVGSYPFGITTGPRRDVWFCVGYSDAIGRVSLFKEGPPRLLPTRAMPRP